MAHIRIREGFKNQILYVIPRQLLPRFSEHPLVQPQAFTHHAGYSLV